MRNCYAAQRFWTLHEGSGWEGIRTPGALRHTRFPGVHNRPLCHPSSQYPVEGGALRRRNIGLAELAPPTAAPLQLQAAEQFIERQLNADKKFTEIRIFRA